MVALRETRPGLSEPSNDLSSEARTRFLRGNELFDAGDYKAAIEEYDRALHLVPGDPSLLSNRGVAKAQCDLLTEALGDFTAALTKSADVVIATNRALALLRLDRFDEAIQEFERILVQYPSGKLLALMNRGVAFKAIGQKDKALADFEEALREDPNLFEALHNKAVVLYEGGRLKEALECINKALALRPDDTNSLTVKRAILDADFLRMVRKRIISWSGGKPAGSRPRIKVSPGQPLSEWLIENRR